MEQQSDGSFGRRWPRLDGVDLLRGLAILFVLLNHVNMRLVIAHIPYWTGLPRSLLSVIVDNGQRGVQMFFAISGFLITSTSIRRWGDLSRVRVLDFYRIRFARIAPLLLLLILSVVDVTDVHKPGYAGDSAALCASQREEHSNFRRRKLGRRGRQQTRKRLSASRRAAAQAVQPLTQGVQSGLPDFSVRPAASSRNVEGVIGILQHAQCGAGAQTFDQRSEQARICELITTSLNEQHRNANLLKVSGAVRTGSPGGVQWEGQEHQPADCE